MKLKLDIVYEDQDLVIVNKAPGVLTLPDRFKEDAPNLYGMLNQQYGKIFVVHRLDRETSGLICFALNETAHSNLSQQFQKRETEKTYLAITEGTPTPEQGDITLSLEPNKAKPGTMKVSRAGKHCLTQYQVAEKFKDYALVEAKILTGRMHQIRVHFAFRGYPLAVDPLYGRNTQFLLSKIKHRGFNLAKHEEELPIMERTTLHAWKLSLNHPSSGERMHFECDPPKDFQALLKQLRKWNIARRI
jgi:RluA family pseudouridine synthase